ncbi:hypothetical protein AN639_10490 [Candidatus Epulonipiscium fishelsonii]|uniref:Uncharacterized protein n=1 Tax=Candidatus Epulonipiscium fishelsonii TaxID=77094 RepID=A0ACC8XBR8_9FIRM|nr:hypothetical protein AN396_07050 [Epulopiscium sp. SCG-B11WGA-EpuloA1]ONI43439.1 hypothetical protein AN639_10490 [Epulopiscium sp. SCG-B05WGA-EpuloA1]
MKFIIESEKMKATKSNKFVWPDEIPMIVITDYDRELCLTNLGIISIDGDKLGKRITRRSNYSEGIISKLILLEDNHRIGIGEISFKLGEWDFSFEVGIKEYHELIIIYNILTEIQRDQIEERTILELVEKDSTAIEAYHTLMDKEADINELIKMKLGKDYKFIFQKHLNSNMTNRIF